MTWLLVLLQIVSIGLWIWAVRLGFSVLQGKASPTTHMGMALTAVGVSVFTHALGAFWVPKKLK